jgi:PKD domain
MTQYANDLFVRTVATGWGTAPIGGAWTEALSNATSQVGNLGTSTYRGRIGFAGHALAASGDERLAAMTPALDLTVTGSFNTPANWFTPSAGWAGSSVWVFARVSGSIATPIGYFARAEVHVDRSMRLVVGHTAPAGVVVDLVTLDYPAGTALDADNWRIEFDLTGTPTKARARLYRTTAIPAPSAGWLIAGDEAGPQTAGVVQVRFARAARATDNGQVANLWDWYAHPNPAPAFSWSAADLAATFNVTSATDISTSNRWDFGDGTATATGITVNHTYAATGTYRVSLSQTMQWGATYVTSQYVTVAAPPPAPPEVLPIVMIDGVDVCDLLYSATWSLGRTSWTDAFAGQTCSIRLRGLQSFTRGQAITITAPAAVGAEPLWVGIVDQVTEVNEIEDGRDDTLVTGTDRASRLGRRHLHGSTILPQATLPARLDALRTGPWQFRYRYAGHPVDGTRWPTLLKRPVTDERLRERTFLDMIAETLTASIAFAYVAPNGDIVYGPWEAPAGVPSTPSINLNVMPDCASRVTLDRDSLEGIVNRWSEGSTSLWDFENTPSIESYGEHAWTVADDVLLIDGSLPHTTGMRAAMADPLRAATVEVPIIDWAQKTITAEPMDFATWNTRLYSIMGVRHEVNYLGARWTATLALDRNPWEIDGRTPP